MDLEIHPTGSLRKPDEIEGALEGVFRVRSGVGHPGRRSESLAPGETPVDESGERHSIYKEENRPGCGTLPHPDEPRAQKEPRKRPEPEAQRLERLVDAEPPIDAVQKAENPILVSRVGAIVHRRSEGPPGRGAFYITRLLTSPHLILARDMPEHESPHVSRKRPGRDLDRTRPRAPGSGRRPRPESRERDLRVGPPRLSRARDGNRGGNGHGPRVSRRRGRGRKGSERTESGRPRGVAVHHQLRRVLLLPKGSYLPLHPGAALRMGRERPRPPGRPAGVRAGPPCRFDARQTASRRGRGDGALPRGHPRDRLLLRGH